MKGVVKLKVPAKQVTPKLFVMILKGDDGKQYSFQKVAYDLSGAINQCCHINQHHFSPSSYIRHSELSVDEINSLFKNFNG